MLAKKITTLLLNSLFRRWILPDISRLSAEQVRKGVVAGTTILVCAYDNDEKFEKYKLEGAIPLSRFNANVSNYPKDTEIVFYCA